MILQFQSVSQMPEVKQVMIGLAGSFTLGGVVAILILFISRVTKSDRHQRTSTLRRAFQKILNKIIVNESVGSETPDAAFEFYMAELRMVAGNSSFARRVLIAQILELKKSLTGNSANALTKTYNTLGLVMESRAKLTDWGWEKRASGIRDLAEMGCTDSVSLIRKSLRARNQTLREETLIALIRLDSKPLSFLDSYDATLSEWMRINIFNYLKKIDTRRLPVFSQWFNHSNTSVVLFAISMAREFKQISSVPGLASLLYSADPNVVGMCITAVGDLEAYQYRDDVARLSTHVWKFPRLASKVVSCLGKIGDIDADAALLGKFLAHPTYAVRFEAVAALRKFGEKGEYYLRNSKARSDFSLDGIINHFSDPLLQ